MVFIHHDNHYDNKNGERETHFCKNRIHSLQQVPIFSFSPYSWFDIHVHVIFRFIKCSNMQYYMQPHIALLITIPYICDMKFSEKKNISLSYFNRSFNKFPKYFPENIYTVLFKKSSKPWIWILRTVYWSLLYLFEYF